VIVCLLCHSWGFVCVCVSVLCDGWELCVFVCVLCDSWGFVCVGVCLCVV
jgi:hypothetical protein